MVEDDAAMLKSNSIFLTLTVAFLITGSLIGAGILALPVKTGLAGFYPSLLGMLVVAGAMLFTALVLAGEATRSKEPTFHYATLYESYLGFIGKWIAILANLIVLYGLLTAYLTGATTAITKFMQRAIPDYWILIIFFIIMTGVLLLGLAIVRRYNAVLMILLWASFAIIVFVTNRHVHTERLSYVDWRFLPASIPIIATAFYFHNIIPVACRSLNWNFSQIWKTLVIGILIGYAMYAIWMYVTLGALPLSNGDASIAYAFHHNFPATIPLAQDIGSALFSLSSLLFAILAITTSYIVCGTALMAFIRDLAQNHLKIKSKVVVVLLSFGPPLVVSLIYPDVFLKVLDIVGGVGIVVLFGILPCIIAVHRAKTFIGRLFCIIMLILFSGFLILEIAQETGYLHIKPHMEHWKIEHW